MAVSEQGRRRQLVVAKRRATALLAAVSIVFFVTTTWGGRATWTGYVEATAAASMVGGLADWFAVTALFRRPLGLPIPHTAIVVDRKDQFAATLATFIRESFLDRELLVERVRTAGVVGRLGSWLAKEDNAARVAAEVADAAVAGADLLRDEDVHGALEELVRERVDAVPLAPLAGRALRFFTEGGRHDEVLDAALTGLDGYLATHGQELRRQLGQRSRWWLPGAVEDRIFDRLLDGVRTVLQEMAADRDHDLRKQFDARLRLLAAELETSVDLYERAERLKREVLSQPQVREWVASLWADAKAQLRAEACDPESQLRRRLVGGIMAGGRRLQADPELAAVLQTALERAVRYLVDHFEGDVVAFVSGTIARWDAEETASRLELLLGPDLQYVRINGTVVGAAAGLALHLVTAALS
ncbi:MAG TPA: DUF445 domain-containing protein [Acidimicrobiales bacterium]|jgi:uncharacterized membrane-anchored protein YjiN (DUF445 family)|nr:DUF445 domain-containing protein [Acidimicrobiales bacterium]